jgi:iron(III) transport system substrate-binding protein
MRISSLSLVAIGLLVTCCGVASRAEPGLPTLVELANDSGPNRTARLIEGAKREGALTVYSSATSEDMAVLTAAFDKKYGVKVRSWRASSENIIQRVIVEARGGRFDADVIETGALAMEAMQRETLFQEVKTSALADLVPGAVLAHREWIGTRFNVFAAAYNTGLIKRDDLPQSYHDLKQPKWRGKLGVEAEDSDWFGAVVSELGEEAGLNLFRAIVTANGISVRKGHTLLANLVVSGEVPFALTTYAYKVEQLKKGGAPIDWLIIPPGVARFEGVGVARRSLHPHAAILFFEFMLTDAQELLRDRDFFPTSRKSRPLPTGASVTFLDPARGLDENQKWSKYFREIILNQAR